MYKPLVISRSYLLEKSATGQIQRVFWEYMHDHGFRPTVICSGSSHNDVPKDSLKCDVIPTYDCQLIRYFIAFLKRFVAEDFANMPDYENYSWAKISAIKRAKEESLSGAYDHIYSVCMPYTDHLVALEAKKVSGLPWIASFYDPWYEMPYRSFKFKSFKEKNRKYEEMIAENADAILHTNHAIYNEWVGRYGEAIKKKMHVMPLVFNMGLSTKKNSENHVRKDKFVISHIGTLYPNRDSSDFLRSLRLMLDMHPELIKEIELNYVGTVTDIDREKVEQYKLSEITKFWGFLNEKDCGRFFENSDLFIAIDGKNSRNIFFPSKILKYFYYEKPILGLTPNGSALQYELEKSNNYCYENENYQGIADFLFRIITEEKFPVGYDRAYWKNFTMEKIYPQYIKILESISKD